jgi:hypothetical protein
MGKSASVVAVSVVAALTIAWFWLRSNDATMSPPPEVDASVLAVPAVGSVPSAAEVEEHAPESRVSPVATQGERDANGRKISDAFERGFTSTFVANLTSKGVSREDSERIVAEAMRELASCVRDAIPEQEFAPPAPPEPKAGTPPVTLSGTFIFFNDRVQGCMAAVYDRIGLPPATRYEVRLQGGELEFAAGVVAQ